MRQLFNNKYLWDSARNPRVVPTADVGYSRSAVLSHPQGREFKGPKVSVTRGHPPLGPRTLSEPPAHPGECDRGTRLSDHEVGTHP